MNEFYENISFYIHVKSFILSESEGCRLTVWLPLDILYSAAHSAFLCSSMAPLGTASYVVDVSVQKGAMDV